MNHFTAIRFTVTHSGGTVGVFKHLSAQVEFDWNVIYTFTATGCDPNE